MHILPGTIHLLTSKMLSDVTGVLISGFRHSSLVKRSAFSTTTSSYRFGISDCGIAAAYGLAVC